MPLYRVRGPGARAFSYPLDCRRCVRGCESGFGFLMGLDRVADDNDDDDWV